MLFLWGKTYPEFGYKQGMNEIMAILLLVFDTERVETDSPINWDDMAETDIANSYLIEFLFDPRYLLADVYTVHDRILQLGIQMLYQDTKDISLLRKELGKRNSEDEKKKRELFEFKQNRERE